MNPCKQCLKAYGDSLCATLGHCAFEGTNEKPAFATETQLQEEPEPRQILAQ